jgi:hypothetical protein
VSPAQGSEDATATSDGVLAQPNAAHALATTATDAILDDQRWNIVLALLSDGDDCDDCDEERTSTASACRGWADPPSRLERRLLR